MRTVKYISGTSGKEFILNQGYEVTISECNPHSVSYGYDSVDKQYGVRVSRFTKDPITLTLKLKYRGSESTISTNLDAFFAAAESDILNQIDGSLYIGNEYLNGYFLTRETTPSAEFYGYENEVKFFAPTPFWIKPISRTFLAEQADASAATGAYLDYPYDYAYDYTARTAGTWEWNIDHFCDSAFTLQIFGYIDTPKITISGHVYQIDGEIKAGEYITIDSRDNTIKLNKGGGIVQNAFNLRNKESDIFQAIPSGLLNITSAGTFTWSLTLYLERSEPRWI